MKKLMRSLGFKVVLSLAFMALSAVANQVESTVASVKGDVQFSAPGSTSFEKLKQGDRLKVGSKVKTGSDGAAIIAALPGAVAQVGANSVLTLAAVELVKKGEKVTSRKVLIDVAQGSVIASIDPKLGKTDFKVRTPKAVASAKGTSFGVSQNLDGSFSIVVSTGSVSVTLPDGSTTTVNAGQKMVITVNANGTVASTSVIAATAAETSVINAATSTAIALNLLTGGQTGVAGTAAGATGPAGDTVVTINPANTSGNVSEDQ